MNTFLLLLSACTLSNPGLDTLWNPEPVAASDGLYFTLPHAGALVRVLQDGSYVEVDLNGAMAKTVELAPDGETLVVFAQTTSCKDGDERDVTQDDCVDSGGELVLHQELQVVRDGTSIGQPIEIPRHFNRLTFTSDGTQAVAWLEYTPETVLDISAVDNLTEVVFVDLESVAATPVAIGDVADRILFDQDDSKALILSRSQVAVVELASGDYNREVTFPLALDVDDQVLPTDLVLTADGRYALLTIQGSGDLYVLDLVAESINIVSLDAVPTDLVVEPAMDTSVLVYGSQARLDLLDHNFFDLTPIELEEPVTTIHMLDGQAFVLNTVNAAAKDAYRVDLETGELTEYRLENPAFDSQVHPDGNYAVAFTNPEGGFGSGVEALFDQNYGVELLDMSSDNSVPLVAAGEPIGLAFRGSGADSEALVLVRGFDDLMQVDLDRATSTPLALEDTPLGIGSIGDSFYITLDSPLGMVSFLGTDGELTTASNFAEIGLLPTESLLIDRTASQDN